MKWFEWGLITDITPSDLETRIVILRKKDKAMVGTRQLIMQFFSYL